MAVATIWSFSSGKYIRSFIACSKRQYLETTCSSHMAQVVTAKRPSCKRSATLWASPDLVKRIIARQDPSAPPDTLLSQSRPSFRQMLRVRTRRTPVAPSSSRITFISSAQSYNSRSRSLRPWLRRCSEALPSADVKFSRSQNLSWTCASSNSRQTFIPLLIKRLTLASHGASYFTNIK